MDERWALRIPWPGQTRLDKDISIMIKLIRQLESLYTLHPDEKYNED